MNEWKTAPAEKFCLSVRDGTHDSPKPVEVGRKLITSRHMISGRLDLDSAYLISATDFEKINHRSKVDQWDVLISMIGTVGDVYLEQNDPDYAIKNIGLFKSRSPRHGRWLYYYLKSPEARAELRSRCRGTTQLYIPLGELRAFPIRFPRDEAEQEHIVEILGSLDDKIELNRRMNETLEAMAQAIFRDWFVDFGPTRRKLDGATDPVEIMGGLVANPDRVRELADLFPASIGDNGLPEGWIDGRLVDILELAYGKSLTKGARRDGPFPVYGSGGIGGWHDTALVKGPSIVVGRKGTVGSLYWEDRDFYPIDTVFFVKSRLPMAFCYYLLQTLGLEGMNTDAAVPGLNRNNAYRLEVPVAKPEVIGAFHSFVGLWRRKITANSEEISTLTATRDLLLPKLMSGEIRLRDAERAIEAVA